jgi:hypothetical protein
MKRPSIKSPCVADRYADPNRERIAEFLAPNGKGGLIRVHQCDNGNVTVEVYRCDEGVTVIAALPDNEAQANVAKYDAELNRLEIAPNGDDYNAIVGLMNGAAYVAPKETGR